jgi:hypothetical protein
MIMCFDCVFCLIQLLILLIRTWIRYFIQCIHLCLCILKWTWVIFYCNLSLGLATKARACRVAGQEEARKWRKVWGNEPSHSQKSFHFGSLESRWTSESSEDNFRGQNSMDWGFLYIIEKLLKLRCLKWARMTHLEIQNTSYGQKKGRESTQLPYV